MRKMCEMPCKMYLSGSEKRKKEKMKQVRGICRKLALQIKKKYAGGGHHTGFAMGPVFPSYATAEGSLPCPLFATRSQMKSRRVLTHWSSFCVSPLI
jgi:hypothetical protein